MKNASDQELTLILFTVGELTCAVNLLYLAEVTEPLPSTPLPFVPAYVDGLVNVAGQIMPQINAMRLLESHDERLQTLLILQVDGIALSLRVNQVLNTIAIPAADVVAEEAAHAYLAGRFNYRDQPVLLLDAAKLTALIKASKSSNGKPGFLGKLKENREETEQQDDFLLFQVAGKDYALALQEVDEIIELHTLTAQPRAPSIIAGISLIRAEPRLILNLAGLLGQHDYGSGQVAVMVDTGNAFVGLLIDQLIGIESIARSQIRYNRDKQQTLERKNRTIVPVLAVDTVLAAHLPAIQPFLPASRQQDRRAQVKQIELLRFLINGDAYAFQISHIKRVLTDKQRQPLLSEQAWIIGTIDMEGKVIPVIDLIAQLGYQSRPELLREYIVIQDGQQQWALAIHVSEQIIAVDEPAIDWVDAANARYVAAFVNNKEQLLTILNPLVICRDNQQQHAV